MANKGKSSDSDIRTSSRTGTSPTSSFKERVIKAVNQVPLGRVTNYGHIALLAGQPRAARQVGWVLAGLGPLNHAVPWWRVVNKQGYISIRGHEMDIKEHQREFLEEEGVEVSPELVVDLEKYGWFD